MKLFLVWRSKIPLVEGDPSTIDVDGEQTVESWKVERSSIDEVLKDVKKKYAKKLGSGVDDCWEHKRRIYLSTNEKNIAMEIVEIQEGEMVDEYGFGNYVFRGFED